MKQELQNEQKKHAFIIVMNIQTNKYSKDEKHILHKLSDLLQ